VKQPQSASFVHGGATGPEKVSGLLELTAPSSGRGRDVSATGTVKPTRLTQCTKDSECVAVHGDCCGCAAGGTRAVVAAAVQAEFEAARRSRCNGAVCATVLSTHPSCSMVARCVEGSCRLVPAPDGGTQEDARLSEEHE